MSTSRCAIFVTERVHCLCQSVCVCTVCARAYALFEPERVHCVYQSVHLFSYVCTFCTRECAPLLLERVHCLYQDLCRCVARVQHYKSREPRNTGTFTPFSTKARNYPPKFALQTKTHLEFRGGQVKVDPGTREMDIAVSFDFRCGEIKCTKTQSQYNLYEKRGCFLFDFAVRVATELRRVICTCTSSPVLMQVWSYAHATQSPVLRQGKVLRTCVCYVQY
eukprot:3134173-Rhodomonas_salina.1